jgi:hypothetical protein
MEIHGWSAERILNETEQYKVIFSFRDVTIEKEIQWLVDLETGNINPLDSFAKLLMTGLE